jgi:hypothetical protein
MVVFIDESGTNLQEGHSTMAAVFVEINNLEKFNAGVLRIEKQIRIDVFHWAEERWLVRNMFLERL